MFDIGFTELMIIGVVALVVIGPERLPRVARTVGHLLGRVQRYIGDVKSDVQREMQLEDLKNLQREVTDSAREIESSIRKEAGALKQDLDRTADSLHAAVDKAAHKDGAADAESGEAVSRQIAQQVADATSAGTGKGADEAEAQLALHLDRKGSAADKENKA